jgi:hypothetical protein
MSIAPYGYTLTVWTSGAVLTHARGIPTTVDALLFMVGAVVGFALVGVASFGGFRSAPIARPDSRGGRKREGLGRSPVPGGGNSHGSAPCCSMPVIESRKEVKA